MNLCNSALGVNALRVISVIAGVIFGDSASANTLGPTRASQLVTLDISGETTGCPAGSNNQFFDTRMRKDGRPQFGFQIPSGKVLIITSAEVEVRGELGTGAEVRLLIGDRNGVNELSRQSTAVDASGFGTANFQLSTGFAIASGRFLCLQVQGTAAFFAGTAHGYLAADS